MTVRLVEFNFFGRRLIIVILIFAMRSPFKYEIRQHLPPVKFFKDSLVKSTKMNTYGFIAIFEDFQ